MVTAAAKPNLVIRTDAGTKIGNGHLMRSIALGQAWRARTGGAVIFVTNCEAESLRQKLKNEGFEIFEIKNSYPHAADWAATRKILENYREAWCAVDGYHFDAAFHEKIRRKGNRILVVDDTAHLDFYEADAILNQNINAADLHYNCPKNTDLLLGTRYALLRNEFLAWKNWKRNTPAVARKILITMGGGDFHNQTLKSIRAVEKLDIENLEIKAVVGANNSYFSELKERIENSPVRIDLIKNAENMPELMAWADAAISAAGSTCWEMAFLRLPAVLLVTAENQSGIAEGLEKNGFAENLGWFEQIGAEKMRERLSEILNDSKRRERMSERGGEIVNGSGAQRVVDKLVG